MPAQGKKTQNVKLQLGSTTSPQTFTNMASITGIQGLNSGGATEIDATNFDSAIKEFIRGLRDGGTITVNLNFDPDQSTHQTLWNLNRQGDTRQWRVLFTSGDYFEFNAFINNLQLDFAVDDIVRGSMPLRVVSEPMMAG
jgi:hypothetical protein